MDENIRLARDLLFGEPVLNATEDGALRVAEAQAFAMLAVAEAIGRVADALDGLRRS